MTEPAATTAPPKPKTTSAPVDLATIKEDLGIAPSDTTNDAWLQRRIDALWAAFQIYTERPLLLVGGWVDDWGMAPVSAPAVLEPAMLQTRLRGSVFLRVYPVASITKVTLNGADSPAADVLVDKSDGKLLALSGAPSLDLGTLLVTQKARIEYTAGFVAVPADLYDTLLGALSIQWTARQALAGGVGVGGFLPTKISAIDVGQVDLSLAPNLLVEQSAKRSTSTDPLLGPYAMRLDPYIDYRSMLGGALPTTVALP